MAVRVAVPVSPVVPASVCLLAAFATRLPVVVADDADAEGPRDHGGHEADGRTHHGDHRSEECVVARIESAPVSGAVIRKDMHDDREAPLRRISATTGTTEQLHSGIGTPMPALVATDFSPSSRTTAESPAAR